MKINKKLKFGMFFLMGILLMVSLVSATYSRSNPNYGLFDSYVEGTTPQFDESMCEAGQDFIIQIAPFGCTPAVVRSDLLEEQNVPVFCQLGATKINPLIDVEAIETISFTGEYPEEISGVGFHPAKSALGVEENLNFPVLNNIGYAVIVLKKQKNASAMPEFVEGTLKAKIRYDIKNAFGIGKASFYLPEFTDNQWGDKYIQYGFWDGKGYLRAEGIDDEGATISIYDDIKRITSVSLKKGETSEKVYMPGFDCLAGLEIKLEKIENPDTRVKLRLNGDIIEVPKNGKFLENKCEVRRLDKAGLTQKVSIKCNEDGGNKNFDLKIEPKLKIKVDGIEGEYKIGDILYDFKGNDKKIFLGYFGETSDEKQFIVPVVSPAHTKEDFLDSVIYKSLPTFIKSILSETGIGVLNVLKTVEAGFYGSSVIMANALVTGSYPLKMYAKESEGSDLFDFTAVFGRVADAELQIPEIEFLGFAGPQNKELDDNTKEYYENAIDDYDTILESFSGEKESEEDKETFGEKTLYNKIVLAENTEQKKTVSELCEEFKEKYPNSDKNLDDCDDEYKLSSSSTSSRIVIINGKLKRISFEGIYEPSEKEYSVEIFVEGSENDYTGLRTLQKNEKVYVSESEFIVLNELGNDYAEFDVRNLEESIGQKLTYSPSSLKINLRDYKIVGKNKYKIRVDKINLKKIVKASVIPNIDNVGAEASFDFKIGIEKRAIELSPEKTKSIIEDMNDTIQKWTEISEGLGVAVKGLKTACLGVGAGLTIKNFFANTGGKAIARQEIMRGNGGWYERCSNSVSIGEFNSMEKCFLKNADEIDNDVNEWYEIMEEQNSQIKELQKDFIEPKKFLSESVVDEEKFMDKYAPQVKEYLKENLGDSFDNPDGVGDSIDMTKMRTLLSYDSWKNDGNYNLEQLREIELYTKILESNPDNEMAKRGLYSVFLDVQTASESYVERANWADNLGVSSTQIGFLKVGEDAKELSYDGLTNYDIGISGIEGSVPIKVLQTSDGKKYIIVLDDSSGTYELPIKKDDEGNLMIYDSDRNLVSEGEIPLELKNVYFKKYDAESYENKYKNYELRYYETEPYKGLPAVVPFDVNNGWYAATKPTLPSLGSIRAYDDSGRVTSFWLCNVGENGLEEFKVVGDDICAMINLGTGQPYNQFPGLEKGEASNKVEAGVNAIEQASRQYKSGVSNVNINVGYGNINMKVGNPAIEISDMQCQDFMSPKDCNLLFNVCDPVVCPSSRCDFGGAYPVKDVVQSGIIGSIALCMPNFNEGIYIPICLTGVKAGVDGLLSIFTSYQDCLQNSLDNGEMIGVCDEIYSIYMCEFLWRQSIPLAKMAIPKIMEFVTGQNVRGGGEYLGVASAWDTADKSIDYFTQYYAANSYKAFKARTAEEVGGEVCNMYVSGIYPEGGNLIDSLTEPDSPSQFHGRFDEIPFTTATVPPVSHYKVFYHIYAGKDSGAYYKVYLKGVPETSFYQDVSSIRIVNSGYISAGGYASETNDLTASSGYKELCIMVNNQEECGFKQVSTDFAVNYVTDKYIEEQATQTQIKTETGCIAGSASAYSLLSPSIQGGAEEIVNPAIYNRGIIRICATDNPGKGTDAYAGGEGSRWIEVGYCDDEKIKCWLDTESVGDVIRTTTIEEDVLDEVTENQLDILRNEEGYISSDDFKNLKKEIEKLIEDKKYEEAIDKVDENLDNVFLNNEKANLLLLRGDAYSDLAGLYFVEKKKEEEKDKIVVQYSNSRDSKATKLIYEALQEKEYNVKIKQTELWNDVKFYDVIIIVGGPNSNKLNKAKCDCKGKKGEIFIKDDIIGGKSVYFVAGYDESATLTSAGYFVEKLNENDEIINGDGEEETEEEGIEEEEDDGENFPGQVSSVDAD